LTKPFKSEGNRLTINARCRPGGSICVAVIDANRTVMPGREHERSEPFTGDSTSHTVTWEGASDMGSPGSWRQLLFMVRDAEIFSFQCLDADKQAMQMPSQPSGNPPPAPGNL
jgi:hypothetical protein